MMQKSSRLTAPPSATVHHSGVLHDGSGGIDMGSTGRAAVARLLENPFELLLKGSDLAADPRLPPPRLRQAGSRPVKAQHGAAQAMEILKLRKLRRQRLQDLRQAPRPGGLLLQAVVALSRVTHPLDLNQLRKLIREMTEGLEHGLPPPEAKRHPLPAGEQLRAAALPLHPLLQIRQALLIRKVPEAIKLPSRMIMAGSKPDRK